MALAALISACQAIDDADERLRAVLPLAGGTLVEHQARLAAAAGAGPIIVLVERLPAALTAAVDRLRRDGLRVEIARGLADAVDRIHPEEALLVIADGCVAGSELFARVARAAVPAMLTVPDDAAHARYERIDATARWGGLLLIDGARLRVTAARLGEWDLQSTLLRRAVQDAARHIGAFDEGPAPLAIVEAPAALAPLDRALATAARGAVGDWPARYLFPPIVDLAVPLLMRRSVDPRWLAIGAVALALIALPFALFGWHRTALGLLLLSGPLAAGGERLGAVRLAPIRDAARLHAARAAAAAIALLLLAATLAETRGWGCWLLAGIVPATIAALARERRVLARQGGAAPRWLADLDALIWIFPLAAIAASWLGGVAAIAGYAAASFAAVQQRALRLPPRRDM